jgi:hypothetical protein
MCIHAFVLDEKNSKMLSFLRPSKNEAVFVVLDLSARAQKLRLDLTSRGLATA